MQLTFGSFGSRSALAPRARRRESQLLRPQAVCWQYSRGSELQRHNAAHIHCSRPSANVCAVLEGGQLGPPTIALRFVLLCAVHCRYAESHAMQAAHRLVMASYPIATCYCAGMQCPQRQWLRSQYGNAPCWDGSPACNRLKPGHPSSDGSQASQHQQRISASSERVSTCGESAPATNGTDWLRRGIFACAATFYAFF